MHNIEHLLVLFKSLKLSFSVDEFQIHESISEILTKNNIEFIHEYRLAPHCRIDFFVSGIGIEVKKSKPNRTNLIKQINNYINNDSVQAIIVVTENGVKLPEKINNKPVYLIDLNLQWGIAL